MRTDSITSERSRTIRRTGILALALALIITGFATIAPPSQATPVSLTFDNGRFTVGLFNNRVILPADSSFPSPDLPTPQRTDIQLNGDLTNGRITIPAAINTGLQFPYMHLMHPIEPGLKVPLTMRLSPAGLSGTWNAATGAMTLGGTLDLIVITGTGTTFPLPDSLDDLGLPPLGLLARCRFDNVPVSFSTDVKSPTTAQAFSGGFGVGGALTTAWEELPDSTSENGGDCEDLNQLVHNPGGIWLSNGIVDPVPQPPDPEPTCETDFTLCPDPTFRLIDDVRLRPRKRAVKAGRKLILTVRVHNSGNIAAKRLKVRIKSSNKRFRVPKTVTLTVPAGKHARKKFRVRVKRNARGRARITARSNGWAGHSYLKVRPKKVRKHHRRGR